MITPEDLATWKALCDGATSGPWTAVTFNCGCCGKVEPIDVMYTVNGNAACHPNNAAFIVTARTAFPRLIEAYEALQADYAEVNESRVVK
jgi:hypothetical protein